MGLAIMNLIDDFKPIPTTRRIHTFIGDTRLLINQTPYHYANPIMYSFEELNEAAKWCFDTFGHPGHNQETMQTVWNYQSSPDYIFWFGEEKHLVMFILRWS